MPESRPLRLACWRAYSPADTRWAKVHHLAFESIAAHCRHRRLPVELVHCPTAAAAIAAEADAWMISSVSGAWPEAAACARRLAAMGRLVLMGGPHLTSLPSCVPPGTIGVVGEGEETACQVLRAIAGGQDLRRCDRGIPGTIVHGDCGWLHHGPPRPRLRLEEISHLPVSMELAPGRLECIATRGCPFRCWFCSAWRIWRVAGCPAVSRFAPAVIAEQLAEYFDGRDGGIVTFQGLTFSSSPRWVLDLCRELRARGAPGRFRVVGTTWSAAHRDPAVLEAVRSIGVEWLGIGMETASPALFRRLKPHLHVEDNVGLIEAAAPLGLQVRASFIVGTPGETADDLAATERFIRRWTGPAFRQNGLFAFTPFPGTPAWDELLATGRVGPDMDWHLLACGADPRKARVGWWNDAMPYAQGVRWRNRLSAASRP